jgi:hypothetical protein
MRIEINHTDDKLFLLIVNDTDNTVRIWEFHNSWGWFALKWIVHTKNDNSTIEIKKLETKAWTKNHPDFFEISPGSVHTVLINFSDGDWQIPEVGNFKEKVLILKCVLEIPPSPEAGKFNVFVGKLESNEIAVPPPHRWLFANQ